MNTVCIFATCSFSQLQSVQVNTETPLCSDISLFNSADTNIALNKARIERLEKALVVRRILL